MHIKKHKKVSSETSTTWSAWRANSNWSAWIETKRKFIPREKKKNYRNPKLSICVCVLILREISLATEARRKFFLLSLVNDVLFTNHSIDEVKRVCNVFIYELSLIVHRWLVAAVVYTCFIVNTNAQMWNDIGSAGVSIRNKNIRERIPVQRVPESYDIIDTASAHESGVPAKNCTGGGCCIPKCFAEKGNRGLPGVNGYPGPKGSRIIL